MNSVMTRTGSVLIVGLVRNGSGKVGSDVIKLRAAVGSFSEVHWLLVESDSTDDSISELAALREEVDNFRFVSLGSLQSRLPLRTQRIAHCRNVYLDEIENNPLYESIKFVIVADFDGINTLISQQAIDSCWIKSDWAVCTANQAGPYYDIWALRHERWVSCDYLLSHEFLTGYGLGVEASLQATLFSRMITIPETSCWIEVESAFGGLAVYKREAIAGSRYSGLTIDGREVCEHVSFHANIRSRGNSIFINPRLINAAYTEHSDHIRLHRKLVRLLKHFILMTYRRLRS